MIVFLYESDGCAMAKYPFYLKRRKVVVIDALCSCGHLHTMHDRTFLPLPNGRTATEYCEGKCCEPACECLHFHWVSWVTQDKHSKKQVAN